MAKIYAGQDLLISVNNSDETLKGKVIQETERLFIIGLETGGSIVLDKADITYEADVKPRIKQIRKKKVIDATDIIIKSEE